MVLSTRQTRTGPDGPAARRQHLRSGAGGRFLPGARFAADFFHQLQRFDAHAPVHRLAHVVDREQRDARGRQSLHLNAGPADGFGGRGALNGTAAAFRREIDFDARQRQRMAQWNQVRGVFRGLDAGNSCNAQHIPFFCAAGQDLAQRRRFHHDAACGFRHATGFRLVGDVDHPRLALRVKMCQDVCNRLFFHF